MFLFLFSFCLFGDVAFPEYFLCHCRFLFEWRVRRTFFPLEWCFFYLLTTGWIFYISLRDNLINQSINQTRQLDSSCFGSSGLTKLSWTTTPLCGLAGLSHAVLAQARKKRYRTYLTSCSSVSPEEIGIGAQRGNENHDIRKASHRKSWRST